MLPSHSSRITAFLSVQIELLLKSMHGGFYGSFQQARDATCVTVLYMGSMQIID